jgi:hypothetical protein
MIYVGLDDTDIVDSPGTNQLARQIVGLISDRFHTQLIARHQLLQDPRVPYTSKNGCASLLLESRLAEPPDDRSIGQLTSVLRQTIRQWSPAGSDPGMCVATTIPAEVVQWGRRCQRELVTQQEARALAAAHGICLEGLGGTQGGVIGALAAVGLVATGEDGRVLYLGSSAEDFYDVGGWQSVESLRARGIAEIRCLESEAVVDTGRVHVGKRLRPNYRRGKAVLYVSLEPSEQGPIWQAVKLL